MFDQLIKKHEELFKLLKDINFISEGTESITYNFTEIIRVSTFVEFPEWLKSKRCVMNPQNNDNKCSQYSIILSLYHEQIKNNFFRISKIKPYINNLNWNNINFPPQEQDYKTLEMNNKSIALNILSNLHNTRKISNVYKSEFNKTRKNQVILIIITDGEKQHYLAVKNLNSLLRAGNVCSKHMNVNHFHNLYLSLFHNR